MCSKAYTIIRHSTTIPIEPVHSSLGQPIRKDDLAGISINYDFEKKTYSISLSYKKRSK